MSAKHKAHGLIIKCIDFRFQERIEADAKSRGLYGNSDEIAWPGASKDSDNVSKSAELSIRLHDPSEVLIYEHEDCGAYGENNSEEIHRQNAQRLKEFLEQIKPGIKVVTLIATFQGIKGL